MFAAAYFTYFKSILSQLPQSTDFNFVIHCLVTVSVNQTSETKTIGDKFS